MARPIEHIVLFKLKSEATQEQKAAMRDGLLSLHGRIPGIVHATCGTNFSDRAAGHHIGFVVRFEDRAALETYLPHPLHRQVVDELVRPIMHGVTVVDYEI